MWVRLVVPYVQCTSTCPRAPARCAALTRELPSLNIKIFADVNSEDLDRQNLQVQEHEVQHDNSSSADSNGDNSASDTKPGGPGETEPPIVKIVPAVKPESMESVHQPTSDDMSFETNGDVEVAIRNRTATKQERPRIPQSLSRTSIVSVRLHTYCSNLFWLETSIKNCCSCGLRCIQLGIPIHAGS